MGRAQDDDPGGLLLAHPLKFARGEVAGDHLSVGGGQPGLLAELDQNAASLLSRANVRVVCRVGERVVGKDAHQQDWGRRRVCQQPSERQRVQRSL